MGDTGELDAVEIRRKTSGNNAPSAISKGGSRKDRNMTPEELKRKTSDTRSVYVPKNKRNNSKKKPSSKNKKAPAKKPQSKTNLPAKGGKTRYVIHEKGNYNSNDTRRKNHSRKKKRIAKIRRMAAFVIIVLAVLAAVSFVFIKSLFKIKQINIQYPKTQSVTVKRKYTNEKIIEASGTSQGKNLLVLDTEDTKNNIESSLPYLKVNEIKKEGTNTLVISVKEISATYAFLSEGVYYLTDEEGKLLESTTDAKQSQKCVLVKGVKPKSTEIGDRIIPDGSEKGDSEVINTVFQSIKESKIKKLTEIDFTKKDDIRMKYDGRIRIHLGKTDTATAKMKLAVKTLEEENKNSATQTGELNLTVEKKAYFTAD